MRWSRPRRTLRGPPLDEHGRHRTCQGYRSQQSRGSRTASCMVFNLCGRGSKICHLSPGAVCAWVCEWCLNLSVSASRKKCCPPRKDQCYQNVLEQCTASYTHISRTMCLRRHRFRLAIDCAQKTPRDSEEESKGISQNGAEHGDKNPTSLRLDYLSSILRVNIFHFKVLRDERRCKHTTIQQSVPCMGSRRALRWRPSAAKEPSETELKTMTKTR